MEYTLKQAVELLGIKVRTGRQWIREGKMMATKDPKTHYLYISEKEIERLKDDHKNRKHSR